MPSAASPTTSMSVSAASSVFTPWRNSVWSSASRIRILAIKLTQLPGSGCPLLPEAAALIQTLVPLSGPAVHVELAAEQRDSLAHARQAEGVALGQRLLDAEADSVVFHAQPQFSIGGNHGNVYTEAEECRARC